MPIHNRLADLHAEITAFRRDLHMHPELDFDTHRTSGKVAAALRAMGCDEVVEGVGRTGVVALIHGRSTASGRVIGLRADMDALPITEASGKEWASVTPGKMHACGHDGHTAMLLGAAQVLAETRRFDGTAAVIFQPAEEGGGGGREMVNDGMMDRFNIQQVYGLHNMPGLPEGQFAMREGPLMAAADLFDIRIHGHGGHAAKPHKTIDAGLIAAHIMVAAQSIVARNTDPIGNAVVSITAIHTEHHAYNVIPQTAHLKGTVRTLDADVRDMVEKRLSLIASNTAAAFGAEAEVEYMRNYPIVVNHAEGVALAAAAAADVSGPEMVDVNTPPLMGGEDFAFMLNARPGAYIFLGAGVDRQAVHHPAYDFNDAIIPQGVSWFVRICEMGMPLD